MRAICSLAVYAAVVLAGGALAGPWLQWLAGAVAGSMPDWQGLADKPLSRYVLRGMMLIAVAGLWPLLRSLGARSLADLGLACGRLDARRFGVGAGLGFVSLAGVAVLGLVAGSRELDGGLTGQWWSRLPGLGVSAVLVGILEEVLFRGGIQGAIRRCGSARAALVASSLIYAAAHFLRHVPSPAGEVRWWSGLALLPPMAEVFTRPDVLFPGFPCLFLAGLVLGLAYERTGNLCFSIGLHAGWVFWMRSYSVMTDRRPGVAEWLWGSGRLYDGCLALVAMLLVGWWVACRPRPLGSPSHDGLAS